MSVLTTPTPKGIPTLAAGDRLGRDEFERRYSKMKNVKKAELIEGVVHMPSPVSFDQHGRQHAQLLSLFYLYTVQTPGVSVGDNSTVRLDDVNEPQPDIAMLIDPAFGGQVQIDEDGFIAGAPELVAEIAGTSASVDLGKKKQSYARNGVREYLVWRVYDEVIDWFVLDHSTFSLQTPGDDGIARLTVFPGLWIDFPALLRNDALAALKTLHLGLATPEHAAFAESLRSARR
jgi:Uma2 family endonuclease